MLNNGLFTSETDEWETPKAVFEALDKEFDFDLDVCATKENAKCKQFFTKQQNGLLQEWAGTCWMNPPYGADIEKWMEKAYRSSQAGATVVCLLPSRTDTRWFHRFAMCGDIRFIRGRLKFGNSVNSAPFPTVIVVFRPPEFRISKFDLRYRDQQPLPGMELT